MNTLFEVIFKQLITIYIGSSILYLYYKVKGKKVKYSAIINETNPDTGLKKYRYKAFYTGVISIISLILILKALL